jgi:hypothetical protein
MGKKIRVWDGTAWQDVAPSLPYTAIHSAQASMPATGVDGQVWLDTDGTLAGQDFVPLSGGTMTGNLNTPSINSGPIVGRNKILNGDFSIWQRGTSFTVGATAYTADRWYVFRDSNGSFTLSRQTFTPGSAPVAGYEGQHFLQIANTSNGSSTYGEFGQPIEDVRTFAGQTVTFSFWARLSSGNFPNTYIRLAQVFGSGGSATLSAGDYAIGSLSNNWTRYSVTVNVASVSGKIIGAGSYFLFSMILPTAGNIGTIQMWGFQAEVGSVASAFHTATPNQQAELAACQRYYWRFGGENVFENFGVGMSGTSSFSVIYVQNPVPMRIAPTSIEYANLQLTDNYAYDTPVSNVVFGGGSKNRMASRLDITHGAAATAFRPAFLRTANTLNGYLALSAEL